MNQDVDNQLGGYPNEAEIERAHLFPSQFDLHRERLNAMASGLMKFWKHTPRSMAVMYALRCLNSDPLTRRYHAVVAELEALKNRRSDEVAAQNYKAAEICRRAEPLAFSRVADTHIGAS